MRRWLLLSSLLAAACGTTDPAADTGDDGKADGFDSSAASTRETKVAAKFEAAKGNAAALRALVEGLPKGGDLHMHLSGAARTESLIDWGMQEHDCISSTFVASSCSGTYGSQAITSASTSQIIDAWSMEHTKTAPVTTRHDHFFSTFGKFGLITKQRPADLIADVMRTAAGENAQYLELMISLGSSTGGRLGETYMTGKPWTSASFNAGRAAILNDPDVASTIARTRSDLDSWEHDARAALGCGGSHAEPGCNVTVRYLVQGTRIASRESVFGQFIYGFALAQQDPRVVGLNLVQAEDDTTALRNYHDQMVAIGWIVDDAATHGHAVPVSLHAGELVPALVSDPQQLTFHVREAVEIAGASRIGHASDLLGEDDSADLIQEMAQKGIAVEACLTSNQQLLGVEGTAHPAQKLLRAGVPVAFATDDQGILRIDMNDEIVRAFTAQNLGYKDVKRAIRASLASSFLPGTRLRELSACRNALRAEKLDTSCKQALATSERATAEWQLESALDAYEKSLLP